VSFVKRDGGRAPTIAIITALFCVVVAIGAGLQGRFDFSGPRWVPGVPPVKLLTQTSPPQPTVAETAAPGHLPLNPALVLSWAPILIVFAVLAVAGLLLLVAYWLRRRRPPVQRLPGIDGPLGEVTAYSATSADVPTLQRGLELAADVLESGREPRDAIVRAWLGLQEAAEDSGLRRRPAETPTEFTTRVFDSVHADRAAAAALLAVYLRVRFRSAPATETDVEVARRSIRRLRETWPVGAPG
jgi:hypothetical protein